MTPRQTGLAAGLTLALTWPFDLAPGAALVLRGLGMALFSVLLVRLVLPDTYTTLKQRLVALRSRGGGAAAKG